MQGTIVTMKPVSILFGGVATRRSINVFWLKSRLIIGPSCWLFFLVIGVVIMVVVLSVVIFFSPTCIL